LRGVWGIDGLGNKKWWGVNAERRYLRFAFAMPWILNAWIDTSDVPGHLGRPLRFNWYVW
jgi:hypothetical protein